VAGSALATLLLHYRLQLDAPLGWFAGSLLAAVISVGALGFGAHYLLRQLRMSPAALLRSAGG